ncbi:MAG: HAMP domain-containing histidine kinase [Planctomycetes bacterium]|nr:HAMP domain-containing histidine kinase [Planctomycetota bacterium]
MGTLLGMVAVALALTAARPDLGACAASLVAGLALGVGWARRSGVRPAERSELERAIERLHRRRLAFALDVAREVGHDFNNLLTSIAGFCDLACCSVPEGSAIHTDLVQVRTSTRRGAQLARWLHAFESRRTAPGELELDACIGPVLALLARRAPRGVSLRVTLAAGDEHCALPAPEFEAIMLALTQRALRATGPHGQVAVATRVGGDGRAVVEVRDDGAGAPEPIALQLTAELADVELPVDTELRAVGALAARHGAALSLRAAPARGTVVRLTMPPVQDRAPAEPRLVLDPAPRAGRRLPSPPALHAGSPRP